MSDNSDLENQGPSIQDYCEWLDKGWWAPEEAWFVLLGLHPLNAADPIARQRVLQISDGRRIKDLIDRAVADNQVDGLQREGGAFSGYWRAPCKSWIAWAKTKKSIHINFSLLQVLESFEPEENKTETTALCKENEQILSERDFHYRVVQYAKKRFLEGDYFHAVSNTAKEFEKAVKEKSKIDDRHGFDLMTNAFSLKGPLKLNSQTSETEKNEQLGLMHIAMGFVNAIRNPLSHESELNWPVSKKDALTYLSMLSYLWERLDKCTLTL